MWPPTCLVTGPGLVTPPPVCCECEQSSEAGGLCSHPSSQGGSKGGQAGETIFCSLI